jgi:hypothetical protein
MALEVQYYGTFDPLTHEADGLFRRVRDPGLDLYFEDLRVGGEWVRNDDRLRELINGEWGLRQVSEAEAAKIARDVHGVAL